LGGRRQQRVCTKVPLQAGLPRLRCHACYKCRGQGVMRATCVGSVSVVGRSRWCVTSQWASIEVCLDLHMAIAGRQSSCPSTPTTAVLPGGGDFSVTPALTARGPGQQDGPVGAMREPLAPFRDRQMQSAQTGFLMTSPTRTSAHCNRTRTDPTGCYGTASIRKVEPRQRG
jgi:hypothetical protein